MEFQGAKYHIYNRYSNCDSYICKTYRQGYYESSLGYVLFKSEIKSQISNVNPTGESIDQLTANTWRQLPVDRRAYYDHKANESGVTKPLKYPCTGVLRFKRVNGQTLLREDGLISYRPHSEQCPYYATNARLGQIAEAVYSRRSRKSSGLRIENDEPMHRQNDSYESAVESMDHLNGSHDSDEFNQEDTLFSSSGVPLKLVFEEEYKEICARESATVQHPPNPAPLSPPPGEPEIECIVID